MQRSVYRRRPTLRTVGAVIVAAGSSERMEGVDKVFTPLYGRPAVSHTLTPFLSCRAVVQTVLVLGEDNLVAGRDLVEEEGWSGRVETCLGGVRRQDSVLEGLLRLAHCDLIAVHDGARPCVTVELLERCIAEAATLGAAVPALPVTDTIKRIHEGAVLDTVDREGLWAAQTPQVFQADLLMEAYRHASGDATDDAALVERLGQAVSVLRGNPENIKITTQVDLIVAEAILRERDESAAWRRVQG